MKRAKLKYSVAQNRKDLHDMLYEILTNKYSWWYSDYFKLDKYKDVLKDIEDKMKEKDK
tara:strand:- start:594 stop:770 length:177 start_codon:yes stop_codon:yes gene_type:complete